MHRCLRVGGVVLTPLLVAGAATAVLAVAGPGPAEIRLLVTSPATFVAERGAEAALGAGVALLGWACLLWLSAAALLVMAAQLPGHIGRMLDLPARWLAPRGLSSRVRAALGTTVLTSSLLLSTTAGATSPALAAPVPSAPSTTAAPAPVVLPDLDWSGAAAGSGSAPAPPEPAASVPPPPTSPPAVPPSLPEPPLTAPVPDTPIPTSSPAPGQAPRAASAAPPAPAGPPLGISIGAGPDAGLLALGLRSETSGGPQPVVVRRGDTLWGIAARHLAPGASDAAIAAEWPRWYVANRDVVGADPDLILPGQRLTPPPTPAS